MIDMINDQQEDMRVAYARLIYREYVCTMMLRYRYLLINRSIELLYE